MARFGVKEVADCILYDLANGGKPAMFLDSLKLSNLENDAEQSFVQGGRSNARLMSFDFNRTASFAMQDALMRPESIAMQSGAEVVKGSTQAHKREVGNVVNTGGTAPETSVTVSKAPISGTITIYKSTDGYEHGVEYAVSSVSSTKIILTDTTIPDGTQVLVYYQYNTDANAEKIVISSDKFSGFYKVVGLTVIRNADTNLDEAFEIEIPKAKIASAFSINLTPDGEPAVFDMNVDVFKSDNNTDMVILKRIG